MIVKCKLIHPDAKPPLRATNEAAGYDLVWPGDSRLKSIILGPGTSRAFNLGFALEIPPGFCGKIYSRSGLGAMQGVVVRQGVGIIDGDYRGEISVTLFNTGPHKIKIQARDRIAQMVFERHEIPAIYVTGSLSETARGSGGHGSTGR